MQFIVATIATIVILIALVVIRRRRPKLKTMYISALEACVSMKKAEVVTVGMYDDEVSYEIRNGVPIIMFHGSDLSMSVDAMKEWRSNVSTFAFNDRFKAFTTHLSEILPDTHKGTNVVCVSHSRGGYLMSAWCREAPEPPAMAIFIGSPGQTFDCRTRGTHVKEFKHSRDPIPKLGWVTSDHEHEFTEITSEFTILNIHTKGYFVLLEKILERVRRDRTNDYVTHLTAWP